jgi:DNA-binding transcriptional ArsR family regulator
MLTIEFGRADLGNVRFAISPLAELWRSVQALRSPASQALHLPWLVDARRRLSDLDLSVLYALQPVSGYSADFISPPPVGSSVNLEDEFKQVLAAPPERIRLEVLGAYGGSKNMPAAVKPFLEEPDTAVVTLVGLLRSYWERAMAPHWERVRTVLEGDILYRAKQSASGGARALFTNIDRSVHYDHGRLILDKPCDNSIALRGRGLLLVPSAFVWPALAIIDEVPWQPTIIYPARGSALLWEPDPPAPQALTALIGHRRASVLASLDAPRSTTELAQRLDLSAGSVSQHLTVLRHAGLIRRHRIGQVVLYDRSIVGDMLANGHRTEVENNGASLQRRWVDPA